MAATGCFAGVDIGSTMTKVIVIRDGREFS